MACRCRKGGKAVKFGDRGIHVYSGQSRCTSGFVNRCMVNGGRLPRWKGGILEMGVEEGDGN